MKNLLWVLALAGGATGVYFLARTPRRQKLIEEVANLIEQEAIRQNTSVNRRHLEAALGRFETGTMRVFNQYIQAFIGRDIEAFKKLLPEIKTIVVPVIREAPEWEQYERFIFPT